MCHANDTDTREQSDSYVPSSRDAGHTKNILGLKTCIKTYKETPTMTKYKHYTHKYAALMLHASKVAGAAQSSMELKLYAADTSPTG